MYKGGFSGSASSVLERAKSQLQGKRYGVTRSAGSLNRNTAKESEEDDLNAYLSQLSKKTGKSSRIAQDDDDDDDVDLSNISLSSGEGLDLGMTNSSLNASKFLKKSHSQALTSGTAKASSTTLRKSSTNPDFLNKTAPAFTSSALQKAAQLGAKFSKKKAAIAKTLESGSDDDLKFMKDVSSIDAHDKTEKKVYKDEGANRFLKKRSTKTAFYISESEDESIKMEEPEDKFGTDANRFLKKSAQPQEVTNNAEKNQFHSDSEKDVSSNVSLEEVPASRFLKKKPQSTGIDHFATSTPKKDNELVQNMKKKNDRLSRTAPVMSSSHLGLGLDSDEEDLKDFIDNLTPTSSPEVPPIRERVNVKRDVSDSEDDRIISKPPQRMLTPGPGKQVANITTSESSSDKSVAEDVGSSVAESINEEFGGIGANVMRIEDLLPAVKSAPEISSKSKRTKSPSVSDESVSIPSDRGDHQTLNLAGLQTVDDLFSQHKLDNSTDREDGDYKSDFETATEIATQRSDEIPEESIHSGIPSSRRRVKAEETYSSVDSVSKSATESSTRTIPDSYTSESQTTIQSRSSKSYSRRYSSRSKSKRGLKSTSEQTQTYSEDFQSSETDTELDELPKDDDTTTVTNSRSYTSYSETTTIVTPKKNERKGRRVGMNDVAVQADGTTEGLLHHWITDSDILGTEPVLSKIEPTPVTTHMVNPEAMEALTNFSPSLLALSDSLLAQLRYTRESVQNSLRLHRSLVDSIGNDYEYTTLENTKEFIAKHRRPKLTMAQALMMVKQEMQEEDRL